MRGDVHGARTGVTPIDSVPRVPGKLWEEKTTSSSLSGLRK